MLTRPSSHATDAIGDPLRGFTAIVDYIGNVDKYASSAQIYASQWATPYEPFYHFSNPVDGGGMSLSLAVDRFAKISDYSIVQLDYNRSEPSLAGHSYPTHGASIQMFDMFSNAIVAGHLLILGDSFIASDGTWIGSYPWAGTSAMVPEPETWATLLMGALMTGMVVSKRRYV